MFKWLLLVYFEQSRLCAWESFLAVFWEPYMVPVLNPDFLQKKHVLQLLELFPSPEVLPCSLSVLGHIPQVLGLLPAQCSGVTPGGALRSGLLPAKRAPPSPEELPFPADI